VLRGLSLGHQTLDFAHQIGALVLCHLGTLLLFLA
jgi:hypothetical protein